MEFTLLDTLAHKPIDGLSKGMKQRLCLGRTMIHNPSVLILDEPAAGLDPRARIELREMIERLAEAGKAILISSHILTELAEICHRVAIIEQGRLLAVGSVARDQRRRRKPAARCAFACCTTPSGCGNWLAAREDICDLKMDGELAMFTHAGDREAKPLLLRAIVEAAFAVIEFGAQHKSLEDVFLHVTEGRVQ